MVGKRLRSRGVVESRQLKPPRFAVRADEPARRLFVADDSFLGRIPDDLSSRAGSRRFLIATSTMPAPIISLTAE